MSCSCFERKPGIYGCEVNNIFINETNQMVEFQCDHADGLSNDDVTFLTIQLSDMQFMTRSIFDSFVNLSELTLYRITLGQLVPTDFAGCKLKSLTINHNWLREITAGVFAACSDLEYISVGGGILHTIDENAFVGLVSLEKLSVFDVPILEWTHFFDPLPHLTKVDIFVSVFSRDEFPSTLLHSLTKLQSLNVSMYMAREFPFNFFNNATELTQLSMIVGSIRTIDPFIFQPLVSLECLEINSHLISSIHQNAFARLVNLKVLSLASNDLSSLNQSTFARLSNLVSLDLSQNPLITVSPAIFAPLVSLEYLILRNTFRVNLTAVHLNNLRTLDISWASFFRILTENTFINFPNLEVLHMAHNSLGNLSSNVFRSNTKLRYLDIAWNGLNNILETNFLESMVQLEYLDLSDNWINSADPTMIIETNNLSYLNLSRNSCISDEFHRNNMTLLVDNMEQCFEHFYQTTSTIPSTIPDENDGHVVAMLDVRLVGILIVWNFVNSVS
ncbi:Insulin-like growth factor-binding protein complex acid labile subunit [Pseudolycoriella hygida]|uniref:Insulin-like growth factor-binding protein complex acid labile subunit n=1 Tax=Pseudolycoriella hygida TaxID=35572 RepID=A0A9Q0N5F9_9DIPT|nr:Insulin-like growth factor-binding protein complex acid labile subunit [Pseudolycoriella hygida]